MFPRLKFHKKLVLTEEQIEKKLDVEKSNSKAKKDLVEAKELAQILREIREENHFARDFRKTLGGHVGP
jgi:hypothetical protein